MGLGWCYVKDLASVDSLARQFFFWFHAVTKAKIVIINELSTVVSCVYHAADSTGSKRSVKASLFPEASNY